MKHLLVITIALLPSAALAQQFTPQQMLDVMTKSPENRGVRVHDGDRCLGVAMADGAVRCLSDGLDQSSDSDLFNVDSHLPPALNPFEIEK